VAPSNISRQHDDPITFSTKKRSSRFYRSKAFREVRNAMTDQKRALDLTSARRTRSMSAHRELHLNFGR
jgi:hypothetical protein